MNHQLMTDLLSSIRAMPQVIQAATVYRPRVGAPRAASCPPLTPAPTRTATCSTRPCRCPAAARRPRRAGSTPSTRRWTARATCALNATTEGRPCTQSTSSTTATSQRPSWSPGCRLECDGSPYSWASTQLDSRHSTGPLPMPSWTTSATWWRCRNERRTSRSHRRRVR